MKITEKDIFVPVVNKDMRKSYPELAKIPEFKDIGSLDIKFCWYYAIFFSDISPIAKRVQSAIDHSYRHDTKHYNPERFLKGDFPDRIRTGIK